MTNVLNKVGTTGDNYDVTKITAKIKSRMMSRYEKLKQPNINSKIEINGVRLNFKTSDERVK